MFIFCLNFMEFFSMIRFFFLNSVTNVWWQKYPNPHSLQVDTVDTIDRHIDKMPRHIDESHGE